MDQFHKQGYLQELNRQFLHPLGLSLALKIDGEGKRKLYAIWDHRDSKDHVLFKPGLLDPKKKAFVENEQEERGQIRISNLGFIMQPIEP
jgi:hypothetical protein